MNGTAATSPAKTATLARQALKPEVTLPQIDGPPVSVCITARGADLLADAAEVLLSTTEKEDHLAQPVLELITKLANAQHESLAAVEPD